MANAKDATKAVRRWVWIRGLARSSVHWGPFPEIFKAHFPNDKIEMIDTRGNGSEAHTPSYLSVEENVRDLRSRSKLLTEGPVHLLSISLGSMIAIEWAHLFPQEIAGLVVINTSDPTNSKFYERLNPRNYFGLLQAARCLNSPYRAESFVMEMVAPNCPNKEKWIQAFSANPMTKATNVVRQLIAASRFQIPRQKPACPTLILGSHGDRFVDPSCTEKIARMWGQEPIWHPSAGHETALEDPKWVCHSISQNLVEK
jgi:pimeloyl-ACP methyl ester carboxylesterase